MSRIHEALKRAEQEKIAGYNSQKGGELVEVPQASQVTQPVQTAANVPPSAAISNVKTEPHLEPIRFETLWANCSRHDWKLDPSLLVFSNSNPFNPGTEQFRTLRSRLYRIRENQPLKTVLISSAIPSEGKTLVSTNLAYAMARQKDCRVLLIDADLRAPRVYALLGAPPTPGLADYLQGGADEFAIIQKGPEEGLYFIPGGNHAAHPSELISNNRMKEFLARVKPAFDWIIIDSSPVLPVADASVLGGLCDGVLLVVRANSTPSEMAQKACQEFRGANILGVVLNTVEGSSEYGSYYTNGIYGPEHIDGRTKIEKAQAGVAFAAPCVVQRHFDEVPFELDVPNYCPGHIDPNPESKLSIAPVYNSTGIATKVAVSLCENALLPTFPACTIDCRRSFLHLVGLYESEIVQFRP